MRRGAKGVPARIGPARYLAGTTTVLGGGFGLLLVKVTQPARASALKRTRKNWRM